MISDRIFCISEIEDIIFDYLDPSTDLKSVICVNHYYHTKINQHSLYVELKDFCKQREKDSTHTDFVRACKLGKTMVVKIYSH